MTVRVTLYSDFNCPFCYALHERLDRLQCWDHVQWKGVQHAPFLSVPMTRWSGGDLSELRDEVAFVQRLAPEIVITVPSGKPNTKLAIAVVAGVMATYPEQARRLIQSLYRALWRDGLDLSSSAVIEGLTDRIGFPAQQLLRDAVGMTRLLEAWENDWRANDHSSVPLLERNDRAILVGLTKEEDLRRFMKE
ncbi:MAG: DsbA family oxidoreductase [Nitrospiraceae bacterium]